jgi:hypothetical protein
MKIAVDSIVPAGRTGHYRPGQDHGYNLGLIGAGKMPLVKKLAELATRLGSRHWVEYAVNCTESTWFLQSKLNVECFGHRYA